MDREDWKDMGVEFCGWHEEVRMDDSPPPAPPPGPPTPPPPPPAPTPTDPDSRLR